MGLPAFGIPRTLVLLFLAVQAVLPLRPPRHLVDLLNSGRGLPTSGDASCRCHAHALRFVCFPCKQHGCLNVRTADVRWIAPLPKLCLRTTSPVLM